MGDADEMVGASTVVAQQSVAVLQATGVQKWGHRRDGHATG